MRGDDLVFEPLTKAPERVPRAIRRMWFRLGKDLKTKTSKDILRIKDGREYRVPVRSRSTGQIIRYRIHIASKPFDTHANLTGKLRRSLSWKVHSFRRMDFGYGVSTAAANKTPIYARAIEFGRTSPHTIAPRPSIKNNLQSTLWDTYFTDEIKKAFVKK